MAKISQPGPSTKFAGQRADGLADGALEPGGVYKPFQLDDFRQH